MKGIQSLLLSTVLILSFAFSSNADLVVRQIQITPTNTAVTPTTSTPTTPAATTPDGTPTTATPPATPTAPTTTPADSKTDTTSDTTSATTPSTTPITSTTPTLPPTSTTPTAPTTTPTTPPGTPVVTGSSLIVTETVTGPNGVISTSVSTSSPSPSAGSDNDSNDDSGGGFGTGSIIGVAVAGGVAVIGIIAFFVWKFTRKRFSDFDDNEAIKWPDLNTHGADANASHPLPVNNTGRSGFDTGSDGSLSRVPSTNYSTPDLGPGGPDPYAVPPLPHLNPNQPYRDDPAGAGAYYDPYHGPVPGTIEHHAPVQEWGGEVIPMTQMGGRMSPGPHAAYGAAEPSYDQGQQHYDYNAGRMSPGPHAAYAEPSYDHSMGRQSPGPQAPYGGRTSPGPQAALGGRASPGPHAAYGGVPSPQPPAAGGYDAYGGRL